MNNNTNKWAVAVGNVNLSEAIQLIAFQYGYRWPGGGNKVQRTIAKYLIFNPEDKSILCASWWSDVDLSCSQVVNTIDTVNMFDQALSFFKTPPTIKVGTDLVVNKLGDVVNQGTKTITADLFDKLVSERVKILASKGETPVVSFTYTSQTEVRKLRHVAVIKMDNNTILGLDLDDGRRSKLFFTENVRGKVEMTGFVKL